MYKNKYKRDYTKKILICDCNNKKQFCDYEKYLQPC